MLNRFSSLCRKKIDGPEYSPNNRNNIPTLSSSDSIQKALLVLFTEMGVQGFSEWLSAFKFQDQVEMMNLLNRANSKVMYASDAWSVLDSGSSRHLNPRTLVTHDEDRIALKGFNDHKPSAISPLLQSVMSRESSTV